MVDAGDVLSSWGVKPVTVLLIGLGISTRRRLFAHVGAIPNACRAPKRLLSFDTELCDGADGNPNTAARRCALIVRLNLRRHGGILSMKPNGNVAHCRTMKVPYAKKWQNETDKLRKIVLDCDLTEELKWGKPCFTYQKKNVAIVIPLKDACALSFFKGALLKDPKHILQKIGEAQAGRWIKFTSPKEISALQATLRSYIYEAIEVEESGKKVPLKKASEYVVPEELQVRLNAAPELKAAFEALTPGRRKSYIFHVSGAKQAKTRAARAEKCVPMILSGRGFNELTD